MNLINFLSKRRQYFHFHAIEMLKFFASASKSLRESCSLLQKLKLDI